MSCIVSEMKGQRGTKKGDVCRNQHISKPVFQKPHSRLRSWIFQVTLPRWEESPEKRIEFLTLSIRLSVPGPKTEGQKENGSRNFGTDLKSFRRSSECFVRNDPEGAVSKTFDCPENFFQKTGNFFRRILEGFPENLRKFRSEDSKNWEFSGKLMAST
jgi:hypothetical protein